jgi:hypothetical protein
MSNSFSNQVIAQGELFTKREEYNTDVYRLPKHLDEKVAKIHVQALGGELTTLSKDQAEYIGVEVEVRSSQSTTATERAGRPSAALSAARDTQQPLPHRLPLRARPARFPSPEQLNQPGDVHRDDVAA